jgi:hypothetical protein
VRLEGIEAVWSVDDQSAARSKYTHALGDRLGVVGHMLDYFVEDDDVERPGGKWQVFRRAHLEVRYVGGASRDPLFVDVDTECIEAVRSELSDVRADAAADVEDPAISKRGKLANQRQPTVLSKAPNVARVPERDPLWLAHLFN